MLFPTRTAKGENKVKNKKSKRLVAIILVLTALLWGATAFTVQYNTPLFVVELLVTAVMTVVSIMQIYSFRRSIRLYINSTIDSMEMLGTDVMAKFPVPVMVTDVSGTISWYNDSFFEKVIGGDEVCGMSLESVFDSETAKLLLDKNSLIVDFDNRSYRVDSFRSRHRSGGMRIFLFYDETAYRNISGLYEQTKTSVMFIQIDGMDFMLKNTLESQKNEILGAVDREIEAAISDKSGYIQKIATDKYIVFLQKSAVEQLKEQKFPMLKSVRSLQFGEKGGLTLSIGVGDGSDSISECVEMANAAIDMAVSRGGDQAVIKDGEDYEFFGGVKQAAQISSRVRTRVVAGTLKKMISSCDDVLIMGHAYSDMDCFGAAVALCKTVRELKKPAKIVIQKDKTLASSLIEYIESFPVYNDCMITPSAALREINKDTLLIVVDTHRKATFESPELYEKAKTAVVIDHHRKTPDCVDNALLFYHDPSASSACEMVTELIEYIGVNIVGKAEAEALLSGIMLDTRNFVMRTNARTFEASAFLRSCGADPVSVKRFFADTMETYRARAEIVARARLYGDYAISYVGGCSAETRMAAAQAADELLTISGVSASFVMYGTDGSVNISARSYGALNVQLVMEQLGGGGHQTMAAAQLESVTFETAASMLIDAIKAVKEQS